MAAPESRATTASMPVPTSGASARTSGTAWRCMFEPISARLASSFSRNGISAAATETSCLGDTSMKSTLSGGTMSTSPPWRQTTRSSVKLAVRVELDVGLGDVVLPLLHGGEVDDLVGVTWPSLHRRYGLSMKPYLLTRAKVASELIRPMFGPSGVSIGQMRP